MRYVFLLVLLLTTEVHASSNDCFNKDDVSTISKLFLANEKLSLKNLAIDSIKSDLVSEDFYTNDNVTLRNVSEVDYRWSKDSKVANLSNSAKSFPEGNVCVRLVMFSLPEKIRMKCDDDGAYGYFFDFKKKSGAVILSDFDSEVSYSGAVLSCKAANKYLMLR
ncbi:MAG: sugar ABC transporter permease [Enterobacter ludwigii]|nr:sugar ABC transporter permease [Enterobacter ludwigii]